MLKLSLKAARVNAGLSQKQVAKKLKVSNKTVCAWEVGKSIPNIQKVKELCELYNVGIDDVNFLPENPLKADNSA